MFFFNIFVVLDWLIVIVFIKIVGMLFIIEDKKVVIKFIFMMLLNNL